MTFTNLVCIGQESFNYSDESYKVLQAVSKRKKTNLNRGVIVNQRVKEDIIERMNFKTFSDMLYNGLYPIDFDGEFIEKDIDELRVKINFPESVLKWNKKILRRCNVSFINRGLAKNYKPYHRKEPAPFYQTSPPFFFKNNNFAIIYIHYYCGWECNSQQIEVYKKNDKDEWEYFGYIFIGMS